MKTVIEMAHEAAIGHPDYDQDDVPPPEGEDLAFFERFADLIRADEREACARLCDARVMGDNNREDMEAKRCAADIRSFRARSNR